jgi:hypothetical protein
MIANSVPMEEDNPKKTFECFEEAIKHRSRSVLLLFVSPVRSRLMISISFLFMNEFAKAVENFIEASGLRTGRTVSNLCFAIFGWRYCNTRRIS